MITIDMGGERNKFKYMEIEIINKEFRKKWEDALNIRIIGKSFRIDQSFYLDNDKVIDRLIAEELEIVK